MTAINPEKSQAEIDELLDLNKRRYMRGSNNIQPWFQNAVRFWKIYRAMQDTLEDTDEPNTFLPYAFGIVEKIVYKMSEPILKMMPPCRALPKRIGQDEQARKFEQIARNYYSGSAYQLGYISSCREEAIVGSAWEIDQWYQDYLPAKRWVKQKKQAPMPAIRSMAGKVLPLNNAKYEYEEEVEVPYLFPQRIGYGIEFPSFFDIIPEDPGLKRLSDQHWIMHDIRSIAISDLQKQMITDPVTGQKRPVYDLKQLLDEAGEHRPGGIFPQRAWQNYDYGKEARDVVNATQNNQNDQAFNDVDRVWLLTIYEPDRIVSIAQGRYVVRDIRDPWQKPRLPFRLRTYTSDPQFLYGIGALQPIEDMIYELNDIHNLSMANWIRIINKMIVYNEGAIPYKDDFKPSALGRIRVKNNVDVRAAIMEVPHTDPAPSMLTMESNSKGIIEQAISVADFSPGVQGTKQTHKTARGLIQIEQNLQTVFTILQRQQLANAQGQMDSMEMFLSQFQFDKAPYRIYRDDGTTALSEFSKEDIDTQGLGFDYVIEVDPSFGDDMIRANLLLSLFRQALEYEQWRKGAGMPDAKQMRIDYIMQAILPKFGFSDTSKIFSLPNNIKDPSQELELIARGIPVTVQPGEDMIGHLMQHMKDLANPALMDAIKAGKAQPKTLIWLQAHAEQTKAAIGTTLSDPLFAVQKQAQGIAAAMPKQGMNGAPK